MTPFLDLLDMTIPAKNNEEVITKIIKKYLPYVDSRACPINHKIFAIIIAEASMINPK